MYERHRISKTDEHLRKVVAKLTQGRSPEGVNITFDRVDADELVQTLAPGYEITGHDAIVFSFDAYEVFVTAADGTLYRFDVDFEDGDWSVWCCSRSP